MKLLWTETAKQDLLDIHSYVGADNPTAAKRWIERLRDRARSALHAPLAGRTVTEFSRDDIRELIEGNYRIVYQVFSDRLVILTVFEGHALFPLEKVGDSTVE
ncbi:MAG: type II toxin-antitoxin system RelE/ParE family toxin [Deltaproteobacteria bacterium]|nr:type II toxin-antitoxin system RelE/ParE family toxin [Deltaproteobacteria bacterium]MBW1816136.1 type II toxin-antitoxin system RelE/ParE family toxin [Deltaproteobacteria bacterium]MBW2283860.1 type II toxin-antitoxin system RelE/ParE family toxin [Deltaproteobacteria bacterium]